MTQCSNSITGVILVGGKSRRMGRDKAFLEVGGKAMFERVLEVFRESFSQIILSGDRQERFASYGLPIHEDIYPGSALGGLYTGLFLAQTEYVFVCPCDVPFPSGKVINYLCSLVDGYDAVVPVTAAGYEPLFAAYSKNCLKPMKDQLETLNFCVYDFYPRINVRCVNQQELEPIDPEAKTFLNLNTPEEYKKIEKRGIL